MRQRRSAESASLSGRLASKPALREPGQLYGSMPAAPGEQPHLRFGLSRLQCSRKAWSRMGLRMWIWTTMRWLSISRTCRRHLGATRPVAQTCLLGVRNGSGSSGSRCQGESRPIVPRRNSEGGKSEVELSGYSYLLPNRITNLDAEVNNRRLITSLMSRG
jgi:hypothetical protein